MKRIIQTIFEADITQSCQLICEVEPQKWREQFSNQTDEIECYKDRIIGILDRDQVSTFVILEKEDQNQIICLQGQWELFSYINFNIRTFNNKVWQAWIQKEKEELSQLAQKFSEKRILYNLHSYIKKKFENQNIRTQALYDSLRFAYECDYDIMVKVIRADSKFYKNCQALGFIDFSQFQSDKIKQEGIFPLKFEDKVIYKVIYIDVKKQYQYVKEQYDELLMKRKSKTKMILKPSL